MKNDLNTKIWYEYNCRSSLDYGPLTVADRQTNILTVDYDNWYVHYIDGHNQVMLDPCGDDMILAGLNLKFSSTSYPGTMQYEVNCMKAPDPEPLTCILKETPWANNEWKQYYVQALTFHDIDCNKGFLKGFEFVDYNYPQTRYHYSCCGPHWLSDEELHKLVGKPWENPFATPVAIEN